MDLSNDKIPLVCVILNLLNPRLFIVKMLTYLSYRNFTLFKYSLNWTLSYCTYATSHNTNTLLHNHRIGLKRLIKIIF